MDKELIIKEILAVLSEELDGYARSAREAHAEATDEQCKAENKYDTRGLEASYLARGQSRQATEVLQAIQQFQTLPIRSFAPRNPIEIGALVELDRKGERTTYFLGPRAGGTEIKQGSKSVLVITPQSPLGNQLIGHLQGDLLRLKVGALTDSYLVSVVQ